MPSIKKQVSITLSFSQKNQDIYNDLQEKKKEKGFNQSEYICDCIRFFEQNKDKINDNINKNDVLKLIDEKLEDFKNNLNLSDLQIEAVKNELDNEKLESDIEDINSSWFEDD